MKKVLLLALAALNVAGANAINTQGGVYQYYYGSPACKARVAQNLKCHALSINSSQPVGCAVYVPSSCLAK